MKSFYKLLMVFGIVGIIAGLGYAAKVLLSGSHVDKKEIDCSSENDPTGLKYEYDELCNPKMDDAGNFIFNKNREACIENSDYMPSTTSPDGNPSVLRQGEAELKYKINHKTGCIETDENGEYIPKK